MAVLSTGIFSSRLAVKKSFPLCQRGRGMDVSEVFILTESVQRMLKGLLTMGLDNKRIYLSGKTAQPLAGLGSQPFPPLEDLFSKDTPPTTTGMGGPASLIRRAISLMSSR